MKGDDSERLQTAILFAKEIAYDIPIGAQPMLAEIMIIWASGYLEATCREVLKNFAEQRAHPAVQRFVASNLDRFRTPNVANIINLVKSFDTDIGNELDKFANKQIRISINSIVAQRNRVAHGRLVNASVAMVDQQFDDIMKFSNKLRTLLE